MSKPYDEISVKPIGMALSEIHKTEKPTIIILGEEHFHRPDNTSIIYKILYDAIAKFGVKHIAIYIETPEESKYILSKSPEFTDHQILKFAHDHGIRATVYSNIDSKRRNCHGLCNDDYAMEITSIFGNFRTYPKHCVIACIGLIHCTEVFKMIPAETYDKHVFNVCGSETPRLMEVIHSHMGRGGVTEELYLSIRRLPVLINSDGGSFKKRKVKRTRKRRVSKK